MGARAIDSDRPPAYLRVSGRRAISPVCAAPMPRRLMVRQRILTPPIEVRILAGHPALPKPGLTKAVSIGARYLRCPTRDHPSAIARAVIIAFGLRTSDLRLFPVRFGWPDGEGIRRPLNYAGPETLALGIADMILPYFEFCVEQPPRKGVKGYGVVGRVHPIG